MKVLNYSMAFLFLVVGFSCRKKEYPKEVEIINEAVYYSNLTVDNKPFKMEAGVDDYYMYSSYKQDSNNVYSFIGELKQNNCVGCANSLKIQINDFKVSIFNSPVKADSSLRVGNYNYLTGLKDPSFYVMFGSLTSTGQHDWDFGDGTTSTDTNPVHIYKKPGHYNVCLTTRSANNCMSTICNALKVDVSKPLRASISVLTNSVNSIKYTSTINDGRAPYKYFWSFGNGTTSTLENPVCNYKYRGSYPVSLMVIDSKNDTTYAHYNAITQSDNSSCASNYAVTKVEQLQTNLALSNIIVTWVDANGIVYTSNNSQQPSNGYFEIISASDSHANENGQLTKKLSVKFKCKVYNGSKALNIDNAEAVICVAYK